jgi:hypothetical protein
MKRVFRILLWLFLLLVALALLLPMFGPDFYRGVWSMAFGWLEFLKRVVPQVSVSGSGLAMVVLCSALIVVGLHNLTTWLWRHRCSRSGVEPIHWRWQWSVCTYALLWLLFLAAIGITGFVHQLSWLLTSNEPWAVARKHRWHLVADLKQVAMEVLIAGEDNDWDISTTQKAFFESERLGFRRGAILQEEVQVLFIPDAGNKLAVAALFYRDPEKQEKAGMIVVSKHGEHNFQERPFADLSKVLALPQR